MNVETFAKQIDAMQGRLVEMYRDANTSVQTGPNLLPSAFKELGVVSEELEVAVEELRYQNQKLAELYQLLEAERQHYQDLFEFTPDAYLVTDFQGVIKEANRASILMLKVQQNFLVGKPLANFINDKERQLFRTKLNHLQQVGRTQEYEILLQPRKGDSFAVALNVSPICDRKGKPTALRWLLRQVSAQRQVDVALAQDNSCSDQDNSIQVYAKGDVIPLKPQVIWQVRQGLVKLVTLCDGAEEVLVGLVKPSMAFGADLTSLQVYQATAMTEVHLLGTSLHEMASSARLAQTLLYQINQRLQQTESLLAISGQRQVKDRLHHLLLLLKQERGESVPQGTRLGVRLTHQDLANACSTTRVTITRLMGKLQQQGKITLDPKNYIILRKGSFDVA